MSLNFPYISLHTLLSTETITSNFFQTHNDLQNLSPEASSERMIKKQEALVNDTQKFPVF